jgi:hypothetical protein
MECHSNFRFSSGINILLHVVITPGLFPPSVSHLWKLQLWSSSTAEAAHAEFVDSSAPASSLCWIINDKFSFETLCRRGLGTDPQPRSSWGIVALLSVYLFVSVIIFLWNWRNFYKDQLEVTLLFVSLTFTCILKSINMAPTRNIVSHDWVNIDGVWIGDWIFWTLTERNYK